jgi:hypothetical protein
MSGRIMNFALFLLIFVVVVDAFTWFGLKAIVQDFEIEGQKKMVYGLHILSFLISLGFIIHFAFFYGDAKEGMLENRHYYASGYLIVLYVAKLIFLIFMIFRFGAGFLTSSPAILKGVSIIALALSVFVLAANIYGVIYGRFDFRIKKLNLNYPHFNNKLSELKIIQISDLHIGSFRGYEHKIEKAVQMVNSLEPDIILFTGDLVNIFAEETEPFVEYLSALDAKYGKYAILGNHDYGEYYSWKTQDAKSINFKSILDYHEKTGFDLLRNENRLIQLSSGDSISLLGVENWGTHPFPQYGDISKALNNADTTLFTVMMSHDPTHWDEEIINHKGIDLTLSGHTHGMQYGIILPFLKWSPVKYRYPKWYGLYEFEHQKLYVNRGLGYIGFPGRVGIPPEITLITINNNHK